MIKGPEEQAFIREAARRTSLAIEAVHRKLSRGMTESEVSDLLEQEFQALGVKGGGLVQFGPSSALPARRPGRPQARSRRRGVDRRGLQGPRLQLGRHAHRQLRPALRRGPKGLRDRRPGAGRRHRGAPGRGDRGRSRPGRAPGDRSRRIRRELHPPSRARSRHGRPRAAVSRPRQRHAALGGKHGDDRARHLPAGQVRRPHRRRLRGPRIGRRRRAFRSGPAP